MNAAELLELKRLYRAMTLAELLDCVRDLVEMAREQSSEHEWEMDGIAMLCRFADTVAGHDALVTARELFGIK